MLLQWIKNLFSREHEFDDAKLPGNFPKPIPKPHQLIDICYELMENEKENLPYDIITYNKKIYARLSEIYFNPMPFLVQLRDRINSNRLNFRRVTYITDIIPYRLLLLDSRSGKISAEDSRLLKNQERHCVYDYSLLKKALTLFGLQAFGDFKITSQSTRENPDRCFQDEWLAYPEDNIFTIISRSIKEGNPFVAMLSSEINTKHGGFKNLPEKLQKKCMEMIPEYLIEEKREFDLIKFAREAKESAEWGTIFSFYLYSKFIDLIIKYHFFYSPENEFTHYLYNSSLICIERTELLNHIKKRFPDYTFHPLLKHSRLTKTEWDDWRLSIDPSYSLNLEKERKQLLSIKLKPYERKAVVLKERETDAELEKYISHFQSELFFYHFQVEDFPVDPGRFKDFAVCFMGELKPFKEHWEGDIIIKEVNYKEFWDKKIEEEHENGSRSVYCESLLGAFFNAPMQPRTHQKIVDEIYIDLLQHIFTSPFDAKDWIVYEANTDNNSWFQRDYWDFLWIAFHKNGKSVNVIYGSSTD